jgi:hypothetical protein
MMFNCYCGYHPKIDPDISDWREMLLLAVAQLLVMARTGFVENTEGSSSTIAISLTAM